MSATNLHDPFVISLIAQDAASKKGTIPNRIYYSNNSSNRYIHKLLIPKIKISKIANSKGLTLKDSADLLFLLTRVYEVAIYKKQNVRFLFQKNKLYLQVNDIMYSEIVPAW